MKIVYVDSSTVVRRYKPTDAGHAEAVALFDDDTVSLVSSTLTYVEVSGALVRAAGQLGIEQAVLLARFDEDVRNGKPRLIASRQTDVEAIALGVVREHGIRALDALHIGAARVISDDLAQPGDAFTFATGDRTQAAAACSVGLDTH